MMSSKRANEAAAVAAMAAPPTLPRVQMPAEHLQILQQRFESLLSSIVGLKEEIAMVPGVDEWPALLHRYTNLLSHAYSLSSSLLSASPHFLPSQLASFNKVLEAEAENNNLYADVSDSSALFGGIMAANGTATDDGVKATADGLPELNFYDKNNPLPLLLAHPVLPISDEHINFLGALLRTAPEADIIKEEGSLIDSYDATVAAEEEQGDDVDAKLERIQDEISQHDILALRALRMWYHLRSAPDEEGNVLSIRERLPPTADGEAEADKEEGDESDNSDEESDDEDQVKQAQQEQRYKSKMEQNCWSAESISAFLRGHATSL